MGEEKKEEEEIVVKVDMHCEACARKVARSLQRLPGVEEVKTDSKASRVVVRGKEAEPLKVLETLLKKCGRTVQLISPLPPPPLHNPSPPSPEHCTKLQPPPIVTVVLSVRMHCEACAQVLQKRIRKIKGVESVETNVCSDQVIVKGTVEPSQLVSDVYKKTRKHAVIVKKELDEKKKEEEEEEEEDDDDKKEKGVEAGENSQEKEEEEEKKGNENIKRIEHWPSKFYTDYAYAPQIFSDENPNACSVM